MMKSRADIQRWFQAGVNSLPIQLIIIQFRDHKFVLLIWIVLLGLLSGAIGGALGGSYLLLEPEYLGKENFWSIFLIGSALGGFLFAYMITLYISESYRFSFIALTDSPFLIFSYNNALIPVIFFFLYFFKFIQFHVITQEGFTWGVWEKVIGLITGIGVVFLLSASFFFARKSITLLIESMLSRGLQKGRGKSNRRVIFGKAKAGMRLRTRAQSYLRFPFTIKRVDALPNMEFRQLVKVLGQHHERLLLIQIITVIMIAVLGLLEDNPIFQIPAGASMLLVFSLLLMISGAVTFWFRKVGLLLILILAGLLFIYDQSAFLHEQHHAFGLSYDLPAEYSLKHLSEISGETHFRADKTMTLHMLDRWKSQRSLSSNAEKPFAVFVTASGGGLRSAYWTLRVMQQLDSLTQGQLTEDIRLMSGASGGMVGLAYFRELQLRRINQDIAHIADRQYLDNISRDLLNRVFFRSFTDMFLPNLSVNIDGQQYVKESGYSFDHQLMRNIPEFQGRKLGHYRQPVLQGVIPPIVLTPTILNQYRNLYISSIPVSFLSRQSEVSPRYTSRAPGVEFRRFFADNQPDSLLFATALRMNATFPYILPVVQLPSEPMMKIMDAGAIDNYGVQTAVRYLFEFKEWFAEHTRGVIFIQIRDNVREDPIEELTDKGYISRQLIPLGGGYQSMTEAKDMANDFFLQYARSWYTGPMEVFSFEYPRETLDAPASLSWHLTRREKENIHQSIYTPANLQALQTLQDFYAPDLIARKNREGRNRETLP